MIKRYDYVSLVAIAAMFLTALVVWNQVPNELPIHWNVAGEIDRYGNKYQGLLLLPLLALGSYLLTLFLPKIDPKRKELDNPMLLSFIRLIIISILVVMYFAIVSTALGYTVSIPQICSLSIGLVFIFFGNVMPKVQSNWFVGVRTPWTLQSEHSWFMTHRLAGWMMTIGGLLLVISSFLLKPQWLAGIIIAVALSTLLLIPYSYIMWKQDKARSS